MPGRRVPPEAQMPPLPSAADLHGDNGIVMILGELRGQFREMIHTMNNMAMKVDGLASIVLKAENLPEAIKEHEGRLSALEAVSNQRAGIPASVADHEARIKALETIEHKRAGAMGLGGWLLKSPLLGWIATAAVTAAAFFTGRAG